MTGTLAEPMSRKVGGYEYRFPVVKADTVYLWPKRPERIVYYNRWLDWPWGPERGWGVTGWVEVPVPARVPPAPRPRR